MWVAMAKKGKEIDLGGFRLQLDPFILIRRVLMRQKKLLALVGVIGAVATLFAYKSTPKVYTSSSQIALRTESMQEDYVRKLVNRAMRDLNSQSELMLIVNELDLFPATRANLPYDISLRQIRRELRIDQSAGSVGVSFESKNPQEAQQVVAFVTERVMGKFANLLDSPYRRQLEALGRGIDDLEPKVLIARTRLFEFKAKHPDIAVMTPDFIREDSPLAGLQKDIERAELTLRQCYAGVTPTPVRRAPVAAGPACRRLDDLKREKGDLLAQFTPSHPSVIALDKELAKARAPCEEEQLRAEASVGGGIRPGMSQAECVEAAKARLAVLHREKVDVEKRGIKKPTLQREWAELTVEANALESQLRALRDRQAKALEDRLVGANEFQENFQLVDAARVPELPTKPVRNKFLSMGIAITLVIGLLLATARESLRQSFMDAAEFEEQTGLQVLAVLPDITQQ